MKDFAIAIFVKTPGLSPIKTRLAQSTSLDFSYEFYRRSIKATQEVISCVQEQFLDVCPYWAIAEEEGLSSGYWLGFEKVWQGNGDLGDRLSHVYTSLKKRHRFVILIGADSPLIQIDHFSQVIKNLRFNSDFVLGPAHDGGFFLFGGSLDLPKSVWKKNCYSTNATYIQLKHQIQNMGTVKELEPIFDVDIRDDIPLMLEVIPSQKILLQSQISIINWLASNTCP